MLLSKSGENLIHTSLVELFLWSGNIQASKPAIKLEKLFPTVRGVCFLLVVCLLLPKPHRSQVPIMSSLHAAAASLCTRKLSFKTAMKLSAWSDDTEDFGWHSLMDSQAALTCSLQLSCITQLLVSSAHTPLLKCGFSLCIFLPCWSGLWQAAQLSSSPVSSHRLWLCGKTLKHPVMCKCSSKHPACCQMQPKCLHM